MTKIKCEHLRRGNECNDVKANKEERLAREKSCRNNWNRLACCYDCTHNLVCEISCKYLVVPKIQARNCSDCSVEMKAVKVNLRIGGQTGFTQWVWGNLSDSITQGLLPVVVYNCPKCGRLEFFTDEAVKVEYRK